MPRSRTNQSHRPGTAVSRRSVVAGSVGIAALPAAAPLDAAAVDAAEDERFMRIALAEASRADLPFGAVIVRDGRILARGRNLGRTEGDPTAHGEMVAIRRLLAAHGSDALKGATLYTSGEPCPMCIGAILWCGIGRLVFAASVPQLATRLDQIMMSSAEIAATARFAPLSITGGVLAEEVMRLLDKK
ncbi:MAG TPA: nucleoside deaminase [Stellaceae bacterium]|nr:nucleoside deaminase [Stellaceae bacterium]